MKSVNLILVQFCIVNMLLNQSMKFDENIVGNDILIMMARLFYYLSFLTKQNFSSVVK